MSALGNPMAQKESDGLMRANKMFAQAVESVPIACEHLFGSVRYAGGIPKIENLPTSQTTSTRPMTIATITLQQIPMIVMGKIRSLIF